MTEALDRNDGNVPYILLSLDTFQQTTNLKFGRKYLKEIFNRIRPTTNLDEITIVSDLNDIYYLQRVTKLISSTPPVVRNFYIWCSVALELWKLYEKESEMNANEKNCVIKVCDLMPMAAIHAIIEPNRLEETIPQVELMAETLRLAFNNSIKQLNWIDSKTKQLIL